MTNCLHSPLHLFNSKGSYMVTASTLHKEHLFKTEERLDFLQNALFSISQKYNWHLEAWSIFPNHYHFIAQSPENPTSLRKMLIHLHSYTSRELNKLDNLPGRKVWYQYWDTQLTFEKSYYARLNYVMRNPVKHKLVQNAEDYRWCSAKWFFANAESMHQKVVSSFKTELINLDDDY